MASTLWKFYLFCILEIQSRSGQLRFPTLETAFVKIILKNFIKNKNKRKCHQQQGFVVYLVYFWGVGSKIYWHLKGKVGAAREDVAAFFMCFFQISQPPLVKLGTSVWMWYRNYKRRNQWARLCRTTDCVPLAIPVSTEIWIFITTRKILTLWRIWWVEQTQTRKWKASMENY